MLKPFCAASNIVLKIPYFCTLSPSLDMAYLFKMRIEFFLTLIGCFSQPVCSYAQKLDTSSTMAVVPFTESFENVREVKYGKIFAERTLTALDNSERFNLIDRTNISTIIEEVDFTEVGKDAERFLKSETDLSRYGRLLKADFIATGDISSVAISIGIGYKATLSFTIKIINVRTGKIHLTENFSVNSGNITKIYNSEDEAIAVALESMVEEIKKFVDKRITVYAKYVFTDETDKKGEMKKATINRGLNRGFRVGQKLDIIRVTPKGPPYEDLGDAEIISANPDDSQVKITSVKKGIVLETMPDKLEVLYFRSKGL